MSGINSGSTPFVEWLLTELGKRKWTREELARRSETKSSVITNIVSGKTALGVDVARRIAKALDTPQRTIFVVAGLMDDEDEVDVKEDYQIRRIRSLLDGIEDDGERQRAIDIVEAVLREIESRQKQTKAGRPKHSAKQDLATGKT